jgi:long-chain fatty acid transport protein
MKKLALVVTFIATGAQAAGFALDTHGARATGMATAVVAQTSDASSAYYNPAGIAQGKRVEVLLGDTLIAPFLSVRGPSGKTTNSISSVVPPPHLYAAWGITDYFSVGLGAFTPFGASSKWPDDWEGRQRTLSSSVSTYCLNPEVAVKLADRLRLGVGAQFVKATVVLSRGTEFIDSQGDVTIGGGTIGGGFNFGAQYTLVKDRVDVGFAYRSDVNLAFDKGLAHFTNQPPELANALKDQGVKTSVRLPDTYSFGVALKPAAALTVGVQVDYTLWSRFQELRFDFDDPALTNALAKRWNNTLNLHVGGEYAVDDALTLRLGVVYDPTPSPLDTLTPDLPDANRLKLTVGVGYQFNQNFRGDFGYQLVLLSDTTSTSPFFPATYGGTAHVFALTLGYKG